MDGQQALQRLLTARTLGDRRTSPMKLASKGEVLSKSAEALRFTFVRNPYARLLSAWSDRFQGRPLIEGKPSINAYRAHRAAISRSLPDGPDQTLSFPEFVEFATATVDQRIDIHWQLQNDFATVPGLSLNLIGKVESFQTDFARVLDHVSLTNEARAQHRPARGSCAIFFNMRSLFNGAPVTEFIEIAFIGPVNACRERVAGLRRVRYVRLVLIAGVLLEPVAARN